jgi:hypothetical protein
MPVPCQGVAVGGVGLDTQARITDSDPDLIDVYVRSAGVGNADDKPLSLRFA